MYFPHREKKYLTLSFNCFIFFIHIFSAQIYERFEQKKKKNHNKIYSIYLYKIFPANTKFKVTLIRTRGNPTEHDD